MGCNRPLASGQQEEPLVVADTGLAVAHEQVQAAAAQEGPRVADYQIGCATLFFEETAYYGERVGQIRPFLQCTGRVDVSQRWCHCDPILSNNDQPGFEPRFCPRGARVVGDDCPCPVSRCCACISAEVPPP